MTRGQLSDLHYWITYIRLRACAVPRIPRLYLVVILPSSQIFIARLRVRRPGRSLSFPRVRDSALLPCPVLRDALLLWMSVPVGHAPRLQKD